MHVNNIILFMHNLEMQIIQILFNLDCSCELPWMDHP